MATDRLRHTLLGCLLLGMLVVVTPPAPAQPYAIPWFTIDGGGGTSSGGVYSLSGTIGQPEAGRMSGGGYVVEGGFWSWVLVLQTPGAPQLSILRSAGNVVLSWPTPSTGFRLEETPSLGPSSWSDVSTPPLVVNGTNQVTLPSFPGPRFFRLRNP